MSPDDIPTVTGIDLDAMACEAFCHTPEPSEHLGLVVPSPGGLVNGKTFTHYIPVAVYDALKGASPGDAYTYRSKDGLEWTATLGTTGAQVVFINQWSTGARSFIVAREHLL